MEPLHTIIDNISNLHMKNNDLRLEMSFDTKESLEYYKQEINVPHDIYENKIIIKFTNVLDFLGNFPENLLVKKKLYSYLQGKKNVPKCSVYKRDVNAIIPYKSRMSDVGYDVHIIKEHKKLNSSTSLYDTGIALKIPFGFYVEVVPRSSLSKSGYMMANSVGIIDRSYRGNLYIALTKICQESPDLEYPFKCCQLVLRKQYFMNMIEENTEEDFTMTDRNHGGYGSTNTNTNKI